MVEKIEDADIVMLWNEVMHDTKLLIKQARELDKPVVTIQHGRRGSSRYFAPFNEKIISDKLLVWGSLDKIRLVEAGNSPQKIEVIGTTIFSHLPKHRKKHEGINVVFSPDHWNKEIPENLAVRDELRKLKGVTVITKIIEDQDPIFYDNVVQSNRKETNHLEICAKVLATADIVVSVAEGTFELMAQALDIPVVTVEDWQPKEFGGDSRYLTYWRHISPAAKRTKLKKLLKTVRHQLRNPKELRHERDAMCRAEGGINLNPVYEIKKILTDLSK